MRIVTSLSLLFLILMAGNVYAEGAKSAKDLAKAAQNPVANMISLPLQNNTNFNFGPEEKTQNILNVQPVIPLSLTKDWNLITRTIIPVMSQPGFTPDQDRTNGIGDTSFTAFLSPAKPGKITWGIGPALLLPTATDDRLGADKWGAGPSVVVLSMPGNWVVGSLFSNVWSVGGPGSDEINALTWQYFINYNLPGGWYLTSAPIITANWKGDSGNKWTIPFGGGVGKIFKIGNQPVNAQLSAYYNAERPDNAPDWQLRFQLQFLFPK